jgi:hypothetical protein
MQHDDHFLLFEKQLIKAIKEGRDEEAFKAIYDSVRLHFIHWGKNKFSRFRSDDDFFQDAFQESAMMFREIVLKKPDFDLRIPLLVFMTEVIGKKWILKWLKKEGRITYIEPEDFTTYDEGVDSILDKMIEEELEADGKLKIEKSMAVLKEKALQCYRLLKFIFYENRSVDEICQLMPYKNPQVVAVKKFICLEFIKRLL